MRYFVTGITITLLLSSVSTTLDSDLPRWKNRQKTQSDTDLYSDHHFTSQHAINGYVPSIGFESDGYGISKRSNRKTVHGYYCGSSKHEQHFYEQDYINNAATQACNELGLGSEKKRKNLKPFTATSYQSFQGPYYEYPIRGKHKKKLFAKKKKNKYPNRVVINTQCEIVDVVTNNEDFHYQQCTRGWH
ncbi:hypothetical protein EV44_g0447 [Erysiphe necator]|uniref:Secreted effector protein n=1 Tax=Uncinula necator TaxID=52586 RepID=A0A0B1P1A3_UNCNE|nr:hypothetical protein EV44_g0447 [Erysiphe necator]